MAGWARVLAAGALVLTACGGSDSTPQAQPSPSVTLPPPTPAGQRVQATVAIDGGPDWLATDGKHVFVKQDRGVVSAIDPASGKVAFTVAVPTQLCQGIGVGFDSVWTCAANEDADNDHVVRIDPKTKRVVATIKAGKATKSARIVAAHGRVWVLSADLKSELLGIDPATNKVADRIPLDVLATDIAADDSGVWAFSSTSGQVLRVDTAKRAVAERFEGIDKPVALALGERVWVGLAASTVALDRTTGKVVHTIPAGTDGALALGNGALWIRSKDPLLTRVDAATGAVVERLTSDAVKSVGDLLVAFGSVWASGSEDDLVLRVAAQ